MEGCDGVVGVFLLRDTTREGRLANTDRHLMSLRVTSVELRKEETIVYKWRV